MFADVAGQVELLASRINLPDRIPFISPAEAALAALPGDQLGEGSAHRRLAEATGARQPSSTSRDGNKSAPDRAGQGRRPLCDRLARPGSDGRSSTAA